MSITQWCGKTQCYRDNATNPDDSSSAAGRLLPCPTDYSEGPNLYTAKTVFGVPNYKRVCTNTCDGGKFLQNAECNNLYNQNYTNQTYNNQIYDYCVQNHMDLVELTNNTYVCNGNWRDSQQKTNWIYKVKYANSSKNISTITGGLGTNILDCPAFFSDDHHSLLENIALDNSLVNKLSVWCAQNASKIPQSSVLYIRVITFINKQQVSNYGQSLTSTVFGSKTTNQLDCPLYFSDEFNTYFSFSSTIETIITNLSKWCMDNCQQIKPNSNLYNRVKQFIISASANGTKTIINVAGIIGSNKIDCPVYFSDEFAVFWTSTTLDAQTNQSLANWCSINTDNILQYTGSNLVNRTVGFIYQISQSGTRTMNSVIGSIGNNSIDCVFIFSNEFYKFFTQQPSISTNSAIIMNWCTQNQLEIDQNPDLYSRVQQFVISLSNGGGIYISYAMHSLGSNGIDCPVYLSDEFYDYFEGITITQRTIQQIYGWCVDNSDQVQQYSGLYKRSQQFITQYSNNGTMFIFDVFGNNVGRNNINCPVYFSQEFYQYLTPNLLKQTDVNQLSIWCRDQSTQILTQPLVLNRVKAFLIQMSNYGQLKTSQITGIVSSDLDCPVYFSDEFYMYFDINMIEAEVVQSLANWCSANIQQARNSDNLVTRIEQFFKNSTNRGKLDNQIQTLCNSAPYLDVCSCTSYGLQYWFGIGNVSTDIESNPACNYYKCADNGYKTQKQFDQTTDCPQFDICKTNIKPDQVKDQTIIEKISQFCSNIINSQPDNQTNDSSDGQNKKQAKLSGYWIILLVFVCIVAGICIVFMIKYRRDRSNQY